MMWLYETPTTLLLMIIGIVITVSAQIYVNSAYQQYKKIGNKKGLSGFEVARKILDRNGLQKVHIVEIKGMLADHYDPRRKVVRLSTEIFHGDSIASVSVAAHEASHATQDKENYLFMKIRSFIFPYVSIGSQLGYIAIFIGFFLNFYDLITFGIWLLVGIIIFELVTLPVEYNASNKAKQDLVNEDILDEKEVVKASNMLNAAALTYVAAVAATLLQILRLILMARRRD